MLFIRKIGFCVVSSVILGMTPVEIHAQANDTGLRPDPLLRRDAARVDSGGEVRIDVLANDEDVDPAALRVERPSCGTATVDSGQVVYRDTGNCSGTVTLEYRHGTGVASPTASVTVVITDPTPETPCGPLAEKLGLIPIPSMDRPLADLEASQNIVAILKTFKSPTPRRIRTPAFCIMREDFTEEMIGLFATPGPSEVPTSQESNHKSPPPTSTGQQPVTGMRFESARATAEILAIGASAEGWHISLPTLEHYIAADFYLRGGQADWAQFRTSLYGHHMEWTTHSCNEPAANSTVTIPQAKVLIGRTRDGSFGGRCYQIDRVHFPFGFRLIAKRLQ